MNDDLEQATEDLYCEMKDWYDACPIEIQSPPSDEIIYDMCSEYLYNQQVAEAEQRRDEKRNGDYDE